MKIEAYVERYKFYNKMMNALKIYHIQDKSSIKRVHTTIL